MLGSHIAERLVARGRRVRALVRPSSDTTFLESIGVELVRGNLTDPETCRCALRGVEVLYHSAAKVGDWGPWRQFQVDCIDATRTLAEAAAGSGIARFLHISSTSAYGHPSDQPEPIDETAAMGQNIWVWDPYTRSKVESERLLWQLAGTGRLAVTVIRPSWLYGERDRTTTARLVTRLRTRSMATIGPGDNPMSAIYAGTVAEAAILAAGHSGSSGEAYNITHQGAITQAEFLNLFADACSAPRVTRHVPYRLAFGAAFLLETEGRLFRRVKPPLISRYATWLMGRYLSYSTEKAQTQLGWKPTPSYPESIARTVRWYLDHVGVPMSAHAGKDSPKRFLATDGTRIKQRSIPHEGDSRFCFRVSEPSIHPCSIRVSSVAKIAPSSPNSFELKLASPLFVRHDGGEICGSSNSCGQVRDPGESVRPVLHVRHLMRRILSTGGISALVLLSGAMLLRAEDEVEIDVEGPASGASVKAGSRSKGDGDDKKFRDFAEVTKGAEKHDGLFTLHRKDDHLYAEIKPNQLDQPILAPIMIAQGLAMAGQPLNFDDEWVILFKRVGDRVQLIRRNRPLQGPGRDAAGKRPSSRTTTIRS